MSKVCGPRKFFGTLVSRYEIVPLTGGAKSIILPANAGRICVFVSTQAGVAFSLGPTDSGEFPAGTFMFRYENRENKYWRYDEYGDLIGKEWTQDGSVTCSLYVGELYFK